ncbi:MAG TPA: inositol monophosphatase family protein [Egibacteraceae bacterium]|nr:inositol monophosphatase family protein [Egibacteraceae bacterium]
MSPGARELAALAAKAATEAGRELLRRRGQVHGLDTKTSATDPVTDADRASERLLVEILLGERPQDGLLGEEGASRDGTSGLRWVLDPLDGTVNWLYGFPAWCVSVACEDGASEPGGALAGAVYDALRDELYWAARGEGAWLRDERLRVNDPVPLERALIATGFAYDPGDRRRQAQTVARVIPAARDVRRGGSAALDLCWVAAGRLDGYYEDTTSRWDWAAAALIAREAGAVVTPFGGGSRDGGVVAAGPALHDELRALVT